MVGIYGNFPVIQACLHTPVNDFENKSIHSYQCLLAQSGSKSNSKNRGENLDKVRVIGLKESERCKFPLCKQN